MSRSSCVREERGIAGRAAGPGLTAALLAACLAGVGGLTTAAPASGAAVVVELDGSAVVALLPLAPGQRFGIRFIHSVDGLPVEDWYVVRDGVLIQESTRLVQFGAGMGHVYGEGAGRPDGHWWEVSGIDRHIDHLVLRIGPASVDHRLLYGGRQVNLSACWPGQRLTLRPARITGSAMAAGVFPAECGG